MIIKSTVNHSPSLKSYTKHWLKRSYNSIPSAFAKPLCSDTLFTFIVGCGHSGTTLMAAKLSIHSEIMGIGRETNVLSLGANSLLTIRSIAQEWDYFSEYHGHSCVLEKTPKHVYSYTNVQKIIPNNKFIVMIRNPLDTIASLYKRFKDLDFCINRWIYDNREAIKLLKKPNVLFIKYEDFTENPEKKLKEVIKFIGYEYETDMLNSEKTMYNKTSQADNMKIREQQVSKPIKPNNGGWKKVFDQNQASKIMRDVSEISDKLGYSTTVN